MGDLDSVRLRPVDPEAAAPACPQHYDGRYELPHHKVKLLEHSNPHPRDSRIKFHEEPHIYEIDGAPAQESVSGLAAEFESSFDPDLGIGMMKKSRKSSWPRLDYVVNARQIHNVEDFDGNQHGCMLVDSTSNASVAACEPGTDACSLVMLSILRDNSVSRVDEADEMWYIFDRCMTDDEIKTKWSLNGEDARNRGTEAHLQMELWFNSEPVRHNDGEVQIGLSFVRRCLVPLGAKAFRTEWTIFGEEENVAGCIDLAVILPDGTLYLIDWKRSEKLQSKMTGYSKMKAPMKHLDDCSGCAYALQLSSYQYLIEKYYGYTVSGRALASIHPTKPFVTAVPFMKTETEYLMRRRKAFSDARRVLGNDPAHGRFKCTMSGAFVNGAERDATGKLYDSKIAKLHNIETQPDETLTEEAQELVRESAHTVMYEGPALPWRTVFPGPTEDLMAFSRPLS